jgi:hypothetical protein
VKEEKEKALFASTRAGSAENKELKALREQLAVSKVQVQDLTVKLEKVCMYVHINYLVQKFSPTPLLFFPQKCVQNGTHVF